MSDRIEGNIVNVVGKEVFGGSVEMKNGFITAIHRHPTGRKSYIMPGFVDAHMHIESSMLTPENFGKVVIREGTVAVVTDPHEIANVMGVAGVDFMVENSKNSPLKTFFTIPSCVPATPFDCSGGVISSVDVEKLAASGRFVGLSEMMDIPGVLSGNKEVIAKLDTARKYRLPIDGHAPLLSGSALDTYVSHGISTDHESTSLAEAEEKLALGLKILIREGSAAHNYEALKSLIGSHPEIVMFCTDDSHAYELLTMGHIRKLVARSVANGFDLFDVLRIASINPIRHYRLDVGQLRVGDKADFIVVDNLETFDVERVYIDGVERIQTTSPSVAPISLNNFNRDKIAVSSLRKAVSGETKVISLVEGELLTAVYTYSPGSPVENLESDPNEDIAKIVYLNRYNNGTPQVAFCKGFQLQKGAFASSIAHDSHNIIAVGNSDRELTAAINAVIENKGGLSVCCDGKMELLALPVGGIMSDRPGEEVVDTYQRLDTQLKLLGCNLDAPFMTLSFLSLVVIPEIKIGEKGLFSYTDFNWMEV